MLPSQELLEAISRKIKNIPNHRKESKRKIHFCLFLLGYKAGLRVSEAVSFDLANKTRQGLYRIEKPKGKKERLVYIPKKVIRELKKNNWKPNQTNRWNFYHFLKRIKWELNISKSTKLTPHILRYAFATYQAECGLPLPILQKLLGHSSIRTTALYWKNIYQEPNNEVGPILAGKNWLESKEQPNFPLITENFPEIPKNPKPIFIDQKPLIPNKNPTGKDNSLSIKKATTKTPGMLINEISSNSPAKFSLNPISKKSDQLKASQPLAPTANNEEKSTEREAILLAKIKLLERQLTQIQAENNNLTTKLAKNEQEKAKLELTATQEKKRADNYHQQLKTIVKTLKQWQKLNYYQQLEQKAQIEQSLKPPPSFKK